MSNQLYNTSSVIFSLEEAAAGGYNDSDSPTITTELLQPSLVPVARALNPWDVVVCVAGTLVSLENAVVMALIIYTPTLRAPMFVLIASLALADLLAGLGLILNFVVIYVVVPVAGGDVSPGDMVGDTATGDTAEGYWGLVTLLSAGVLITAFSASVLNVLAITVDRYLSLYNALTYHTERTVTFTYVTLFLIWLTSAALGSLPVLGWNCLGNEATCSICWPVNKNNAAALAVSFLLVFALILQLYLQICKIAFRHAQQIAVQHFMTTSHASSTTKGVSTLSVILGTFALCWIPFAMYSLVADSRYPAVYTYATALPAICHSFINPIIYAFRNPDIQRSLRLACCGCMPRSFTMRPRTPSDV